MSFVVDASVVVSWLLSDEDDELATELLHRLGVEQGIAPGLLWYEVRNTLLVCERRGRCDAQQTSWAAATLRALPIRTEELDESEVILHLARQYDLSIYDAAYLAVAVRLGAPLATLDRRMAQSARDAGVRVLPD